MITAAVIGAAGAIIAALIVAGGEEEAREASRKAEAAARRAEAAGHSLSGAFFRGFATVCGVVVAIFVIAATGLAIAVAIS